MHSNGLFDFLAVYTPPIANDKLLLRIISSTFQFFNVDPYKQRSVKVIWYTFGRD